MKFRRYNLSDCHTAGGLVIVIDILRAFSAEAWAFSLGVERIILADTVERAFDLKKMFPEALLMGEVNGYKVDGFDIGNSPTELSSMDLHGRHIIHRTSAGTQGVLRSSNANMIFVTGLLTASATVKASLSRNPDEVSFVITAGEDDVACADFMQNLFEGRRPPLDSIKDRIVMSDHGMRFKPESHDLPPEDLGMCLDVDRFNFAMKASQEDGMISVRSLSI